MDNKGWFSIHRQLLSSSLWTAETFTRGQAWIDLIGLANFEYGYFYNRGVKVNVNRGECGWSQTNLSFRWKWSRTKVRNFLNTLEKEQQIVQHKDNVNQIVTIVNYDLYQKKEPQVVQQKNRRRTAEEPQKNLNNKNNIKNKDNNNNNLKEIKEKFPKENLLLRDLYNLFDVEVIKTLKEKDVIIWIDTINKLNRLDGYSFQEIKDTIIFGRNHDFWKTNFISIASLRTKKNNTSKFTKIFLQLKTENNGKLKNAGLQQELEASFRKRDIEKARAEASNNI